MRTMPASAVLAERIARHGFIDRPAKSVADAARMTSGLQAQDPLASRLGVRSRSDHLREDNVLRAIEVDRTVVRTWLMRATIHLVAAEDLRWMTRLIGPSIVRKFAKRWVDLGLTPDVLASAVGHLPEILAGDPLTRREVVTLLGQAGVVVGPDPQASTHLLLHASAIGLTCRGPERGRDSTFTLVERWLERAAAGPSGDDALAELARRYFRAFSPATPADFTAWSGLPSARAIRLISDVLTPTDVDGRAAYTLGEVPPQRGLRMLSAFDNYLVGYRDRSLLIAPEHRAHVYLGGMIRPTVLLDGHVVGTWRLSRRRAGADIEVTPFSEMPAKAQACVDAEIEDIARFLGVPASLTFIPPRP